MISQGCAHAGARVGDVIELAALRLNGAYREFFNSIIVSCKINYHTTLDPRNIDLKSTIARCMMLQAGVKE